jgi:hypothetical protein
MRTRLCEREPLSYPVLAGGGPDPFQGGQPAAGAALPALSQGRRPLAGTECGYQGRLFDLNFRQRGAFGHSFIDIWGIHPAEAVPGETLLTTLGELSGCDWRYLYLQD